MNETLVFIIFTEFFLIILLSYLSFVRYEKPNFAKFTQLSVDLSDISDFSSTADLLREIQVKEANYVLSRLSYLEDAADKSMHLYSSVKFTCTALAIIIGLWGIGITFD